MEEDSITHYDLTGGSNSNRQKIAILVKLTDSALKTLLHCARRGNNGSRLRIKFGDVNNPAAVNELIIPNENSVVTNASDQRRPNSSKLPGSLVRSLSDDSDDELERKPKRAQKADMPLSAGADHDRFTFSFDRETGGCVECVERRRKMWTLVGTIEWRVTVHANADVYDTTRERIDECEREARKQRTQTLDTQASSKSTRIVIKKKPTLAMAHRLPAAPAALQGRAGPSAGAPAGSNNSNSNLGPKAAVRVPPSAVNGQSTPSKAPLSKQNVSVRERVLHVLALNTFTKSELILKLQSVGGAMSKLSPLRDDEKVQIGDALNELAESRQRRRGATSNANEGDFVYSLKRQFFAEVNADWPFYDANERNIVKERKRTAAAEELAARKADSAKPAPNGSAKREDDESKQQRPKPSDPGPKRPRMDDGAPRPSPSAADEDYKTRFLTIASDEQRARYKHEFDADYNELQRVLQTILPVSEMFSAFDQELQAVNPNSPRYKELHSKIVATYQKYTRDDNYMRTRQRAQYLHRKLRHIKTLITEYDVRRASSAT